MPKKDTVLDRNGLNKLWEMIQHGAIGDIDYESLLNKPAINSVTLTGKKSGSDLSLINTTDTLSESEIDAIIYGGLG